ncbi:VCBS repeat-containing protein [Archangium minus]|uniref:VCBS repeat-containing protein n=1 Tax=Archangium minus TaxID=83450 RepID=A0ABY9WYC5_9BACT|nr:VCBS repeat-containing protein [Archangium minus]
MYALVTLSALLHSATAAAPRPVELAPYSPGWHLRAYPSWESWGASPGAGFGSDAAAGDVNGDGLADALITAPGTRELYLYPGTREGLSARPQVLRAPSGDEPFFAHRVWFAGDVNGDRRGDVWVGSGGGARQRGRLMLFLGSDKGLGQKPAHTLEVAAGQGRLPVSVSPGDANGDGFSDVLVARCGLRGLELRVGSKGGLAAQPVWKASFPKEASSPAMASSFDCTVELAGDLTGDGRPDAVLRTFGCEDTSGTRCGAALHLYASSAQGVFAREPVAVDLAVLHEEDRKAGGNNWTTGTTMHGRADVDGDGRADLVLAAPGYEMDGHHAGRLYVLYGPLKDGRARASSALTLFDKTELGDVRVAVGDVNRDGMADVVVGAVTAQNVDWGRDRAALLMGGKEGFSARSDWQVQAEPGRYASFGRTLALADFTGDGSPDLLIAAPSQSFRLEYDRVPNGPPESLVLSFGRALLYLGGPAPEKPRVTPPVTALPRPMCPDLSAELCGVKPPQAPAP